MAYTRPKLDEMHIARLPHLAAPTPSLVFLAPTYTEWEAKPMHQLSPAASIWFTLKLGKSAHRIPCLPFDAQVHFWAE